MVDLFVGDSHSCGYYFKDKAFEWDENNYAEKFHRLNKNKETIIYANPGAGNYKYVEWIKVALDRHPDIQRIFIQTTYWNRFRIACSKNLDFGFDNYNLDNFTRHTDKKDAIYRYNDLKIKDAFVEMQLRPSASTYESFKGFRTDFKGGDNLRTIPELEESFIYTKVWHELQSQLQYIQFCKDLYIIDNMCKDRNIPCFIWRINERCHLPNSVEMFGALQKTTICSTSAELFLDNKYDMCISHNTIDGEHYTSYIHDLIAKDFIPYLLQS